MKIFLLAICVDFLFIKTQPFNIAYYFLLEQRKFITLQYLHSFFHYVFLFLIFIYVSIYHSVLPRSVNMSQSHSGLVASRTPPFHPHIR